MADEADKAHPHPNAAYLAIEQLGNRVNAAVEELGGVVSLGWDVTRWAVRPPVRVENIFAQLDFVGVGSIFIVMLTGELAPVFTALMVTMRAVSAMCTELGTMRVTEQVDALETMAVNPVQYLLVPRILAGVVMVPLLSMLFNTAGMAGAYVIAVYLQGISAGTFINRTQQWLDPEDIAEGLIKAVVFGFAVTLIGCYKGYNASGGAKGVGQATTQAMVAAALAIVVLDYVVGVALH